MINGYINWNNCKTHCTVLSSNISWLKNLPVIRMYMYNFCRRFFDTLPYNVDIDGSADVLFGTLYGSVYRIGTYRSLRPYGACFSRYRPLHFGRHGVCINILHDNRRVDFVLYFRFLLIETRMGLLRQWFQQ